TANADVVTANVDVTTTVQVNGFLTLSVPTVRVERLAISTIGGPDTVTVNARDTVSAVLSVDAGDPAPAPNKNGDALLVNDVSPQGRVQNNPGGPTQGAGVVLVTYPRTTNTTIRIDYAGVEKFSK